MWKIHEIVILFGGIILSNVVSCFAKNVCYYSNNYYEVYCEKGYYCCKNNTRCCPEGISTGVIIGITLAALFVFAFCVAGALVLAKKQKAPRRRIEPRQNNINNIQNISVINPPPYGQQSAPPPSYTAQQNYFLANHQQAPPPYTAPYPPPPAYSATDPGVPN